MTKESLISELTRDGYLKTPVIVEAFHKIDRMDFVPEESRGEAYENHPLEIGFGQTISQPLTVAFMLELLEPKSGEHILEVGSGSGWQTALLAYIVSHELEDGGKNAGKITAIERIKELKEMTEANISKYGFVKNGVVETVLGDGSKGYAKNAPYDKIIAAAEAKSIPPAWKEQLTIGGKIAAPVGNSIVVLHKTSASDFARQEFFGFSFVPLVEE